MKKNLIIPYTATFLFGVFFIIGTTSAQTENISDIEEKNSNGYSAKHINQPDNYKNIEEWSKVNLLNNFNKKNIVVTNLGKFTTEKGERGIGFEVSRNRNVTRYAVIEEDDKIGIYSITESSDNIFNTSLILNDQLSYPFLNQTRTSCDSTTGWCNCVSWVRQCKASWLPTGLYYIWDKKMQ